MELIERLISEKYCLFNVGLSKRPVNLYGNGLDDWETLPCDALRIHHNKNSMLWGLRTGLQGNGRYIMTLDFDCCGKPDKQTGQYKGCEYTQEKYDEYAEIADKEDGWYLSSTEGNANVLIDYTDCPTIRKYAETMNGKFSIKCMEVLVCSGAQQVIPPSKTECKINGTCDLARMFKNDEPFYMMTEQSAIYPFVLGLFQERFGDKPEKKKQSIAIAIKQEKKETTEPVAECDDKYLELLYNVIKDTIVCDTDDYWNDYFYVAGILKTNGYSEKQFITWAKTFGKRHPDELWRGISQTKERFSLYGLQSIAKRKNPVAYKEWLKRHSAFISLATLEKGENSIAEHIADQLINNLVYCNYKWIFFDKKIGLWRFVKNPHQPIISHIQDKIDESREIMLSFKQSESDDAEKKKYIDMDKAYFEYYKQVGKGAFTSQITKILETYLYDGQFDTKLDATPYVMAYKNGIMDLKTLKFRKGLKQTDYLTHTIPYNYEPSADKDRAFIRHELLKICNYNESHLEYYLSVIGHALTGDASKIQELWCLRGQTASNGKSVIFEALTSIIPNYVVKMESDIWDENYGSRHKEIATWRGIRIGWLNEMSKKKKDENALKDMSDGKQTRYKVMYGEMATMMIMLKLFIVSNTTIELDADGGVARRIQMMQLDSKFLADVKDDYEKKVFARDTSFGLRLTNEYKFALMDLLFEYSKKFYDDKFKLKPMPIEWKNDTNEVIEFNSEMRDWIDLNFEFIANAKITRTEMEMRLTSYNKFGINKKEFKDVLKAMGKVVAYNSQEYLNGIKGVWVGIKFRPAEVEVAEEVV